MNEHVESLQIDLNSIKEFFEKNIANNTFNQFDSYAINNVMYIFMFLIKFWSKMIFHLKKRAFKHSGKFRRRNFYYFDA